MLFVFSVTEFVISVYDILYVIDSLKLCCELILEGSTPVCDGILRSFSGKEGTLSCLLTGKE